jgi:hypothetical protein
MWNMALIMYMGKYANIGAQLDGIERERDTVQKNINAEIYYAQNSPSRRTRDHRPHFTQTDLTRELVNVLNLSVALGRAERNLTDHTKKIFGIRIPQFGLGLTREKRMRCW